MRNSLEGRVSMVIKDIGGIVVESVHDVYETLIYILPEEGSPEEVREARLVGELISTIPVSGDVNGMIAMVCGQDVGKLMTANMLGTEGAEATDEEVADCAGEIVNMVAGNVKTRFIEAGGNILISIPTVVCGRDLVLSFPEEVQGIQVPFTVEGEKVAFYFLYKNTPSLME
jgi:CheY-specific phosphatase CheX